MEEDFWRQKAAVRWLAHGHRNTKFYQSWVKQKRIKARIHAIRCGDRTISKADEIRNSAVVFYQNLLAPPDSPLTEPDPNLIKRHPEDIDRNALISPPNPAEVREAAFCISADSTSGPDGFTAAFYHSCWDIVGHDVTEAVIQFFNGAFMPRSITANNHRAHPQED